MFNKKNLTVNLVTQLVYMNYKAQYWILLCIKMEVRLSVENIIAFEANFIY